MSLTEYTSIEKWVIDLMDYDLIMKLLQKSEYEKTYTDETWSNLQLRYDELYEQRIKQNA